MLFQLAHHDGLALLHIILNNIVCVEVHISVEFKILAKLAFHRCEKAARVRHSLVVRVMHAGSEEHFFGHSLNTSCWWWSEVYKVCSDFGYG